MSLRTLCLLRGEKEMTERMDFADGKYTVINENGKLTALRHGELWGRDLTGDNLVYWMLTDALKLKAERDALAAKLKDAEHDRDEFRRVMNGFAAKLAELEGQEPVAWQYRNREGEWCNFINEAHHINIYKDGFWPIRKLYARPAPAEEGIVTITTTEDGRCVTVSRQDEDHRVLSVIWEAKDVPTTEPAGCDHRNKE